MNNRKTPFLSLFEGAKGEPPPLPADAYEEDPVTKNELPGTVPDDRIGRQTPPPLPKRRTDTPVGRRVTALARAIDDVRGAGRAQEAAFKAEGAKTRNFVSKQNDTLLRTVHKELADAKKRMDSLEANHTTLSGRVAQNEVAIEQRVTREEHQADIANLASICKESVKRMRTIQRNAVEKLDADLMTYQHKFGAWITSTFASKAELVNAQERLGNSLMPRIAGLEQFNLDLESRLANTDQLVELLLNAQTAIERQATELIRQTEALGASEQELRAFETDARKGFVWLGQKIEEIESFEKARLKIVNEQLEELAGAGAETLKLLCEQHEEVTEFLGALAVNKADAENMLALEDQIKAVEARANSLEDDFETTRTIAAEGSISRNLGQLFQGGLEGIGTLFSAGRQTPRLSFGAMTGAILLFASVASVAYAMSPGPNLPIPAQALSIAGGESGIACEYFDPVTGAIGVKKTLAIKGSPWNGRYYLLCKCGESGHDETHLGKASAAPETGNRWPKDALQAYRSTRR